MLHAVLDVCQLSIGAWPALEIGGKALVSDKLSVRYQGLLSRRLMPIESALAQERRQSPARPELSSALLATILLDAGVQAAQVANQSRVLSLKPEARDRVNTVYMICYFGGGSLGSLLGAALWSKWHWPGVCASGVAFMLLAGVAILSRGPDHVDAAR